MEKAKTKPQLLNLDAAAQLIADGGVLAYPTEGVFGLGCDPNNIDALQRLLSIKERDPSKGLILIAASLEQLTPWILPLSDEQRQTIGDSWPGPTTWILPARENTPALLTGDRSTLAARVTAHPPAAALCRAANTAIISTSANISGNSPARHMNEIDPSLGFDACLNADIGSLTGPTPIFDLRTGTQLRR